MNHHLHCRYVYMVIHHPVGFFIRPRLKNARSLLHCLKKDLEKACLDTPIFGVIVYNQSILPHFWVELEL